MSIDLANRIRELPPYLFAHIDALKQVEIDKGADIIDLGVGDPDLPTPGHVIEALASAARDPRHHQYAAYSGMADFRHAAADYYAARWGVDLDPGREVLGLIGSKEGIAHFPIAFVDPGDVVLVPDPGYPVYADTTRFCGGTVEYFPLTRANNFLPDLAAIPPAVAAAAKIIWINYPNNPTSATATVAFYEELVDWARRHDIVIASDIAYADVYFDQAPPSLLAIPGAMDIAIEFYSLSKTYNMTGWRVAFAAGNRDLVAGLGKVKTNFDSGIFEAVQMAGIAALSGDQSCVAELREIYRERRDVVCDGLAAAGFDVLRPDATFYCLIANPVGMTSMEFSAKLLSEAHIVATPATGFGPSGEGFVRLALCKPKARLAEAVERMSKLS